MPRPNSDQAPSALFVTSELHPLVKTGGLADVSGALPAALIECGVDTRVLLPGYDAVLDAPLGWQVTLAGLRLVPGVWQMARLMEGRLPDARGVEVPIYAIDCPDLYRRDGGPYQDSYGADWGDNDLRFALLGAVAAYLTLPETGLRWTPDILHLNDWQAGLAAAYHAYGPVRRAKVISTVHNLSFAGDFAGDRINSWGLPSHAFGINGIEYYGRASFLKAGLYFADHVTTVSPTYAREIQSAPVGCGFEGLLSSRQDRLSGIINGIDDNTWNPQSDGELPANYSAKDLSGKAKNKAVLQERFGLHMEPKTPLFAMVSRLTWQKGVDTLIAAAPSWLEAGAQMAIIGNGDSGLETALTRLSHAFPGRMGFVQGYDESLAHLLEAGADMYVMPSRFEPCGLNQMYSMRYGTPPLVRRTGGLADTVINTDPNTLKNKTASGFVFSGDGEDTLAAAARRALDIYPNTRQWRQIMRAGMRRDFGWHRPAQAYEQLYRSLTGLHVTDAAEVA